MNLPEFWKEVDREIANHDLLQHPFYQAWSMGKLTTDDLRIYAEQYFRQVSEFPAYLTALHARLPEGPARRAVLTNAWEEECEGRPHSDLWLAFLEGIGGRPAGAAMSTPIQEIADLVQTFRSLARDAQIPVIFGALYAYESQVPRIAAEKLAGLKRFYGADDRTCEYFRLHMKADVRHAMVWREIIEDLLREDSGNAERVLEGVSQAARALWGALDGIDRVRQVQNHLN